MVSATTLMVLSEQSVVERVVLMLLGELWEPINLANSMRVSLSKQCGGY